MKETMLSIFLASSSPVLAEEGIKPTQTQVDPTPFSKEGVPCWQVEFAQRVEKGCSINLEESTIVDPSEPCGPGHPIGCSCECCQALPVLPPPPIEPLPVLPKGEEEPPLRT